MSISRAAGAAAFLVLSGLQAVAIQLQVPPKFATRTDLVRLDVVIVDDQGNAIKGLTQADFQLREGNKAQPVSLFQEVDEPLRSQGDSRVPVTFPQDVADNQTAKMQRLVILVVDDMLIKEYRDKAKGLAARIVAEVGEGALLALLSTSGLHAVEVTNNPASILREISRIGTGSQAPRVPRRHGDQVSEPTVAEVNAGDETGCHFFLLQSAARMVSSVRARKVIVYITPYCDPQRAFLRISAPKNDFSWLFETLRQAGITLYAFDPRGALAFNVDQFRTPDTVGADPPPPEMRTRSWSLVVASRDELGKLAEATGGFSVSNTNDYGPGLARLVSELEHYYVLGFYPNSTGPKNYRDVSVTIHREGANVRSKLGYIPPSDRQREGTAESLRRLSAQAAADGSLPMRLFCSPIAQTDKGLKLLVAIDITVPRSSLRQDGSLLADRLEGFILAVDARTTRVARRVLLPREASLYSAAAAGLTEVTFNILTTIDLPPNLYQVRAAARSQAAGTEGSVFGEVDLSDHKGHNLSMGSLILGRANAGGQAAAADRSTPLPFVPILERRFSSRESIRIWAALFGRATAGSIGLRAELLTASGQPVRRFDSAVPVQQSSTAAAAIVDMSLSLAEIPAGSYLVRVTAATPTGDITRESSVVVYSPPQR